VGAGRLSRRDKGPTSILAKYTLSHPTVARMQQTGRMPFRAYKRIDAFMVGNCTPGDLKPSDNRRSLNRLAEQLDDVVPRVDFERLELGDVVSQLETMAGREDEHKPGGWVNLPGGDIIP
jgi:hypothetical protein